VSGTVRPNDLSPVRGVITDSHVPRPHRFSGGFFVELCTIGIKRDPIFAMPLGANARIACDDLLPRGVAPSDLNLRDHVRALPVYLIAFRSPHSATDSMCLSSHDRADRVSNLRAVRHKHFELSQCRSAKPSRFA
jgi:hypothetical protein